MKNLLFVFIFVFSCFQVQAQQISVQSGWGFKKKTVKASRNVIQKNLPVNSKFEGIVNSGVIDVYYTPGAEYSVILEADDNIIEFIEVEYNDNKLQIGVKKNTSFKNAKAFKVYVSSPELNYVQLNGSGDFYCEELIKASKFKTQQNGSGDIYLEKIQAENVNFLLRGSGDIRVKEQLTAHSLSLETLGSGDIKANIVTSELNGKSKGSGDLILSGTTETAEFNLFGSGDVSASKLTAQKVVADTKGSGDIKVNVTNSLKANSYGSGDIIYKGNPTSVDKTERGSGDIYNN